MTNQEVKIKVGPIELEWNGKTYPFRDGTQEIIDKYTEVLREENKRHTKKISDIHEYLTNSLEKLHESTRG